MKVAVLKPCYFPTKAYFSLLEEVDLCVLMTDLPYAKRHPTTRCRLPQNRWLTVPVKRPNKRHQRGGLKPVHDMVVCPHDEWVGEHLETLVHAYGMEIEGHPLFSTIRNLAGFSDNLAQILYRTTRDTLIYFNIHVDLADSREFGVAGLHGQWRVIETCKRAGATRFVTYESETVYDPIAFGRRNLDLLRLNKRPEDDQVSILHEAFTFADA